METSHAIILTEPLVFWPLESSIADKCYAETVCLRVFLGNTLQRSAWKCTTRARHILFEPLPHGRMGSSVNKLIDAVQAVSMGSLNSNGYWLLFYLKFLAQLWETYRDSCAGLSCSKDCVGELVQEGEWHDSTSTNMYSGHLGNPLVYTSQAWTQMPTNLPRPKGRKKNTHTTLRARRIDTQSSTSHVQNLKHLP